MLWDSSLVLRLVVLWSEWMVMFVVVLVVRVVGWNFDKWVFRYCGLCWGRWLVLCGYLWFVVC